MSEPFIERLSRFTPDAGGLDRDFLLYAAGRASVRPNRTWIALAAALAVTQPLFLILLWPRTTPPAGHVALTSASRLPPPSTLHASTADRPDSAGLWSVRHNALDLEHEDNPAPPGTVTFVESGPPLRAFVSLPSSILN
jgi:hypothetical protein